MTEECTVCGKPFEATAPVPGFGRPQLYCSARCKQRAYVERHGGTVWASEQRRRNRANKNRRIP